MSLGTRTKPRVDFYKLDSQNRSGISRFCCKLADKVFRLGNPVFVKTRDEAETRLLDELMWTFSDNSFLAHAIQGDTSEQDAPVVIGHHAADRAAYLLINLSDELPEDSHNYERIAEIINTDPQTLQSGRARYGAYRKDGYPLHFHEITS